MGLALGCSLDPLETVDNGTLMLVTLQGAVFFVYTLILHSAIG